MRPEGPKPCSPKSSCPHKEDPENSHSSIWVLLKHDSEILSHNCEFLKEPELCGLDTAPLQVAMRRKWYEHSSKHLSLELPHNLGI